MGAMTDEQGFKLAQNIETKPVTVVFPRTSPGLFSHHRFQMFLFALFSEI
jgi:hypothetical protein